MAFIPNKNNMRKYKLDPFAYYVYAIIIIVMIIVFIFHYLITTPSLQSPENLSWYRRLLYFDYMFILFFSGTSIIAGFFLMYVHFGGSTRIGIYFVNTGIVVFLVGFYYFDQVFPRPIHNPSNVYQALVSVLGTSLGFLAALLIAFIVITKVGPHISSLGPNNKLRKLRADDEKLLK